MKKVNLIACIIGIAIISCSKKDDTSVIQTETTETTYIIVNDSATCTIKNFATNPFADGSDSIDIDLDNKNDFAITAETVELNNCDEYLANCPEGMCCDCWTIWGSKCSCKFPDNISIAVDSSNAVRTFKENDTLTFNNLWLSSKSVTFVTYSWNEQTPYHAFLGIRKISGVDTTYGWINLQVTFQNIKINSIGTQRK